MQGNLQIISSGIAAPNMSIIDYNNPFQDVFASLLQLAQCQVPPVMSIPVKVNEKQVLELQTICSLQKFVNKNIEVMVSLHKRFKSRNN
jgi:hypothetical protein